MKTNQIQRNIIQKFVMAEFAKGLLNTQKAIDNMIALVSKKLSMNYKEIGIFYENDYKQLKNKR